MNHLLKLFGERDIASTRNSFAHARNQLSILYTLAFGTLVVILSAVLYHLFASDIHEDMTSVFPEASDQVRVINQHKGKLLFDIVLINGGIILFISGVSYFIAGKTLEPIIENYEAQKRFIADASHDLRTPIAILTADLEVSLRDPDLPRSVKRLLKSNLDEVSHMKHIVEDLLMLFRFDSNIISLTLEPILIGKYISDCVNSMTAFANRKKVTFRLNKRDAATVSGDALLLKRALRNILKNAIEYSDTGGIIRITLSKRKNTAIIEVTNSGIVIPDRDLEMVFDRFYRTEDAKVSRKSGTGLGLSITKEIIEKHSGSISIASNKRQGTTVCILLPICVV